MKNSYLQHYTGKRQYRGDRVNQSNVEQENETTLKETALSWVFVFTGTRMQAVSFPQGSLSPLVWWVVVNGFHWTCHYCLNPSGDPAFPLLPYSSPTSPNPHLEKEWLPKENLNLKGLAQRSSVLMDWGPDPLCFFSLPCLHWPSKWLTWEGEAPNFHSPPPHPLCSDFPTTHLPFPHKLTYLPGCEDNRKPDGKSKWTWLALESRSSHTDQSREDRKVNAWWSDGHLPWIINFFLCIDSTLCLQNRVAALDTIVRTKAYTLDGVFPATVTGIPIAARMAREYALWVNWGGSVFPFPPLLSSQTSDVTSTEP